MKFTHLLTISALAVTAFLSSTSAQAATANVDATVNMLAALAITKNNDMDFQVVEFSAAPVAGDQANLGTDGAVTYAGNFAGAGTGTASDIDITAGNNTSVVEVFCETTGILSNAANSASIGISNVEVAIETGVATGTASICAGLGAAATNFILNLATNNTVLVGARLDGGVTTGVIASEAFSTANAGGANVQVDIFYQ